MTADLQGKRVLVTGASGFIGHHLCRRLLRAGARVVAVSRGEQASDAGEVEWYRGDIANMDQVREIYAATRPEVLFHLASHVKGAPDMDLVLPTFHSNLQTTVNLLLASAETGTERVLLTGSLVEPEPGVDERTPSCPYAAAKWASADYGRMFHNLYGLPVVIARVFMVYGPGQRDQTKLVPYVIDCLARGEAPKITSGSRLIDWIHVDDVVEGLVATALSDRAVGQSVDLGSGSLISTREFVLRIVSLMKSHIQPEFGALDDRPLEPTRTADVATTLTLTGWRPQTDLHRGLRSAIEYFGTRLDNAV